MSTTSPDLQDGQDVRRLNVVAWIRPWRYT
jgi:hypothetical protein